MTVLGSILPSVLEKFDVSKAEAGSLFLTMSFGIMIGSLVFGPIVDGYGYKYLLLACVGLVFIGLEGIAFATSFQLLRGAVFVVGLGGGVINGGGNALVSDISEEGRSAGLSILGVFYGIGAIGVPLVLGSLLDILSYEMVIAWVGIALLLPILYFLITRFPAPKQPMGFPIKQGLGLVKETTLLLFGFMLFFQSGMEIMIGGWSAAFINEVLAVDIKKSVLYLSLFWLGMVSARVVLGIILRQISPAIVLRISLAIAFIGAGLMYFAESVALALPGLFLIGIGFAAGFPIILGYIGDAYPALSGTAFSIAFVIALTGGMLLPWLAGVIGSISSLRVSLLIIPISIVCMFILFTITLRKSELQKSGSDSNG
jgi:fucose permease